MNKVQQRVIIAAIIVMLIIGVIVIALDWRNIGLVSKQAQWQSVLPALFFTAVSFIALVISFMLVNRAFGITIERSSLLRIGFISVAMGNLMSLPAAPEYALRLLLMKQRGSNTKDILAASVFHSYLMSMGLLSLFPIGILLLILSRHLLPSGIIVLGALCTLVIILGTVTMYAPGIRTALLHVLENVWHFFTRRSFGPSITNFNTSLSYGITVIHSRTYLLPLLIGLVLLDWAAALATLMFCFRAVGAIVDVGTLLTGLSGGVVIGFVSLIPGGLGVQEGSMTTIYTLLGVNLEQSILAAVLFRILYYFIPFAVSLAFYRRLLRKTTQTD
jgi:uncharacterized protein (TIRG00374 family)